MARYLFQNRFVRDFSKVFSTSFHEIQKEDKIQIFPKFMNN